jgi:hypothetical protein
VLASKDVDFEDLIDDGTPVVVEADVELRTLRIATNTALREELRDHRRAAHGVCLDDGLGMSF